jgi:imidazolonepropionase-like amidohydrolase
MLLAAIATLCAAGQPLVIRNVTVIDPQRGAVEPGRTVVVDGGKIVAGAAPKGARTIDGRGKFLIPGLWDAHVHLTKAGALSLPLFIANGITGVRDMGSDLAEVQRWRSEIESGKRVGPRIKTSGQILESRANVERMKREGTVEPVDRIRSGVANPEEARAAVDRLAAAGVDHIKMRTTPDLATFRAVSEQAQRHRLPVAAHPLDFGGGLDPRQAIEELIRARLRSLEHLIAFPPLDGVAPTERRALFEEMARSGMFFSNTMVNFGPLLGLSYDEAKQRLADTTGRLDPRRKYVCGYLVEDWREQVEESKDAPYDPFRKQLGGVQRDFRELREAGVPFLAGTDVGVMFMYPGFSLHDELALLVRDVGFRPMEALRIATANPAAFYGAERQFGSVEPGQAADLVLLDADPLADIRNTTSIRGVVAAGRWFDRPSLDRLLAGIAHSATAGCADLYR